VWDHPRVAHLDPTGEEAGGQPAADLGRALAGIAAEHHPGCRAVFSTLAQRRGQMDGERRDGAAFERRLAERPRMPSVPKRRVESWLKLAFPFPFAVVGFRSPRSAA